MKIHTLSLLFVAALLLSACTKEKVENSVNVEQSTAEQPTIDSVTDNQPMEEETNEAVSESANTKEEEVAAVNNEPESTSEKKDVKATVNADEMMSQYYTLTNALVESDPQKASKAASALYVSLQSYSTSNFNEKQKKAWDTYGAKAEKYAENISKSASLEDQRKALKPLSESMYHLAKVASMKTPVYYVFCPMADNDNGGHWLSNKDKVENPYYGSAMFSCGKVVEKVH